MQTPEEIDRIVKAALAAIADDKKKRIFEGVLIRPCLQMREWEWSEPIEKFPCWIVADCEREMSR